jgi:hypothetical protein
VMRKPLHSAISDSMRFMPQVSLLAANAEAAGGFQPWILLLLRR